jgi:hypothetical protein
MSNKLPAALAITEEEVQLMLAAQVHIGTKVFSLSPYYPVEFEQIHVHLLLEASN